MITIKTHGKTIYRFTGRELELNDTIKSYEERLAGVYKCHREEKHSLIAIIEELEKENQEIKEQLEEFGVTL